MRTNKPTPTPTPAKPAPSWKPKHETNEMLAVQCDQLSNIHFIKGDAIGQVTASLLGRVAKRLRGDET